MSKKKKRGRKEKRRSGPSSSSLVPNLLILAIVAWTWALRLYDEDLYYRTLQEDEYLEWATVVAFLGAAAVAGIVARRQWRESRRLPGLLRFMRRAVS